MTNGSNGEAPKTFDIPDYNMPVVEAKIAKLNKRAIRLGAEFFMDLKHEKFFRYIFDSLESSGALS